ncbi:MAG TPA: DUF3558 domain-containing protein [Pseudonocardiaceae bacterium]
MTVLALASACTGTEPGSPSPTGDVPPASGAPTSAVPTSGAGDAPAVSDPRDASATTACEALTAAQVGELALNAGSRRELTLPRPFAQGCAWTSPDSAWSVGFGFASEGLGTLYRARDNFQHFEPRDLDGRPAVDAQTVYNAEDCYTYVGLADDQTLYVNVDNSPALADTPLPPACERLDTIAKMIIGNLPPLK